MRLSKIACGLGLLALAASCHAGAPAPEPLRIGLCKNFSHAAAVLISSETPFTIKDASSGRSLASGAAQSTYRIASTDKGLVVTRVDSKLAPDDSKRDSPMAVAIGSSDSVKIARVDGNASGHSLHWHRYRGVLTVRDNPDKTLQVIDTVSVEQYLYGVLPAEIGANAPAEALKAQAVAARTYALKNRGKFASLGFDLDDTTRCEGYDGIDGETPQSNAAVDATRGEVLTYDGRLIDAPYSSDSGGMTACDTSGDYPYLQAVRDAPAKNGPDYGCSSKFHSWTKVFTKQQIGALLARSPRTHVHQFASLAIDGYDQSGRIATATVTGVDGASKTVTGPQLREILGYDVLRSTLVTLMVAPDGDYQFDGKGWGHGLGMSQDGAVAMASAPYDRDYKQILSHYYVGTRITPIGKLEDLTLASAPRGL